MDARYGLRLVNFMVIVAFSSTIVVNSLFLAGVLDAVCLNPEPFYQTYLLVVSVVLSMFGLVLCLWIATGWNMYIGYYEAKWIIFSFFTSGFCFCNLMCFLLMSRNTAALVCPDEFKNYNVASSAVFGFLPIANFFFVTLSTLQNDYHEEFRNDFEDVNRRKITCFNCFT